MTAPGILFGLGATKAGTTWLYRYLAAHPQVAMPAIKELHWFDTCETGRWPRQVARMRAERARRADRLPTGDARLDRRLKREIAGYDAWIATLRSKGDDAAYLRFLTEGAGDAALVGDLTPAYGTLAEPSLVRMAALSPLTRFVLILRDPLDRLWSNLRMLARRDGRDAAEATAARLDALLAGGDATTAARSDYAGMLARTARALSPAQLFVGFYETFFTAETLAALCRFLGLAPHPAGDRVAEARVLAGEPLPMTETQRVRALAYLAPQYHAVAQRIPALPGRWLSHMEALT